MQLVYDVDDKVMIILLEKRMDALQQALIQMQDIIQTIKKDNENLKKEIQILQSSSSVLI